MDLNEYRPIDSLTETERVAVLVSAEELGESGMDRRDNAFDWECFLSRLERQESVDLGSDAESVFIKEIKKVARRAWREANE